MFLIKNKLCLFFYFLKVLRIYYSTEITDSNFNKSEYVNNFGYLENEEILNIDKDYTYINNFENIKLLNFVLKENELKSSSNYKFPFFSEIKDDDENMDLYDADCLINLNDLKKMFPDKYKEILFMHPGSLKRLRFIYGKCNPILFVPGLMASRLSLKVNCKEFLKEEGIKEQLERHCSSHTVCSPNDEEKTFILWPSIFSDFSMAKSKAYDFIKKKYVWENSNSCMAYFLQYYNKYDSCPIIKDLKDENGNEIRTCRYSKNIRIIPYGLDSSKYYEDKCGFSAINNIAYSKYISYFINRFNKTTQGFLNITKKLVSSGYSRGFSLAAAGYDFKEAECDNKILSQQFYNLIKMLYANTGKQVIIIAHSYGNINTNYLLNFHPNKDELKSMVKHVISIAPPLAGSSKVDQLLVSGSNEFDLANKFNGFIDVSFDRTYQSISSPFLRSGFQLNNIDYYSLLDNNTYYKDLIDAIQERIEYEKCLENKENNNAKNLRDNLCKNPKFEKIFKEYIPQIFDELTCKLNPKYKSNKKTYEYMSTNNALEAYPLYFGCNFNLFNYKTCPKIKLVDEEYDAGTSNLIKETMMCNVNDKNPNTFFTYKNNINKFKETKDFVIKNSNKITDYIPENLAYKKSFYYVNIEKILEANYNHCPKDIRNINIDNTIIFNKSFETKAAFFFKKNKKTKLIDIPTKSNTVYSGGDGTVQSDGALFPALKFAYEYIKGYSKNKIKFVDYCSAVDKSKMYKSKNILNDNYIFLNCECKERDGNYKLNKDDDCNHSSMLGDYNLSNFIFDLVMYIGDQESLNNKELKFKIDDFLLLINKIQGYFPDYCNNLIEELYK